MVKSKNEDLEVRGMVCSLNVSPRGSIEGAMVETSEGLVQVNLPKHDEGATPATLAVGKRVRLAVRTAKDDGAAHRVFDLAAAEVTVTGTIAALNYARHGECNGFRLTDGAFVHLEPEGAKRYRLRVGDEATVRGARKTGPAATVIDAKHVLLKKSMRVA